MPLMYMLIGVPGSGKSTWIATSAADDGTTIISSDKYIEAYAKLAGKAYSDVFTEYAESAQNLANKDLELAIEGGRHIIWDQTNLSVRLRMTRLAKVPDNYTKIAVYFQTPPADVLAARLTSRPGKTIPRYVVDKMIGNLEPPSLGEGFTRIFNVRNFE